MLYITKDDGPIGPGGSITWTTTKPPTDPRTPPRAHACPLCALPRAHACEASRAGLLATPYLLSLSPIISSPHAPPDAGTQFNFFCPPLNRRPTCSAPLPMLLPSSTTSALHLLQHGMQKKENNTHCMHTTVLFFSALACMRWNNCTQCGYMHVAWLALWMHACRMWWFDETTQQVAAFRNSV
jgi:hypothetical protein